ncbi:hypothetical protein LOY35_05050 [Pseudomonas sp. B21-028]|uniref:hypothetical protein n=1 Tax=Pseudomonas sp. B21-028 TaxID=2895480 RepID=UPI00215E5910|nr:hypothetical protein [Pseudomonas sp. B21-028]UVL84961.1 hypothetical protein LOY35_05050 [Pseudomonas sp. B21-028]
MLAKENKSVPFLVRPLWQQAAYLLDRLDAEPTIQAFWLRQLRMWCDRQYQMVDPVTPKVERMAIAERLVKLAALGLIGGDSVSRVV